MIKFIGCNISLKRNVLEPRIETEFWVKKAIGEIQNPKSSDFVASPRSRLCRGSSIESGQGRDKIQNLRMLDIFAGTGCIGTAVLKNIKNSKMDFVDISKEAIEEIKINLKLNDISEKRCKVYQANLFEKVKGKEYDFIFANPPYVARERISEVQAEVLENDPRIALFGGRDGMLYIKKFLSGVKKYLKPGGVFYLEYDPLQKGKIKEILTKAGFKFSFSKDQFGKYRWVRAKSKFKNQNAK